MEWTSAERVFAAWTPQGVIWSDWANPVAFAAPHLAGPPVPDLQPPGIALAFDPGVAAIVDLPGPESVAAGLLLAERGYCPVPLFGGTSGPSPVIDVESISLALVAGAERLRRLSIAPGAPPAFLLDSRRLGPAGDVEDGRYDNRWVALPQDFPSGALLASRGIRSAVLIRRDGLTIPDDLAHVLARWVEQGIRVRVVDVATGASAEDVDVPKPSGFKRAWYAALTLMGFRRSNVGGFGATVPEETGGDGGYG